jgi:hypothetical protein
MLDDTVAVETPAAKPVPRSPDTRAALQYLPCSGANAISITTGCGHVVINVGYKADAVEVFWLPAASARAVAARARKLAGNSQDVESTIAALREAAVQLRVKLIEHDTAMGRAAAAAQRLDVLMDQLKVSGIWLDFTKTYRQRRLAAKARGEGFMPFSAAELRFKRALIPLLQSGGKPAVVGASIFAEVFGK